MNTLKQIGLFILFLFVAPAMQFCDVRKFGPDDETEAPKRYKP